MAPRKRAPPVEEPPAESAPPQKDKRKAAAPASPTRNLRSGKRVEAAASKEAKPVETVEATDALPARRSGRPRKAKKEDVEATPGRKKTETRSDSQNQQSPSPKQRSSRKSGRKSKNEGRIFARYRALEEADRQYLESSKQAKTCITVNFVLTQLPNALGKLESSPNPVALEVPSTADVQYLKRAIFYRASYKLHPMFQELKTTKGQIMEDTAADGSPRSISSYGVKDGSQFEICIKIPEEDSFFEEILTQPAQETTAYERAVVPADEEDTGKNKNRFTLEETEALVSGIETYGLRWRTIVQDPIFANRTNVHLKDRFRNLVKQVVKQLEPRGMVLPYELKQRVRSLVEKHGLNA